MFLLPVNVIFSSTKYSSLMSLPSFRPPPLTPLYTARNPSATSTTQEEISWVDTEGSKNQLLHAAARSTCLPQLFLVVSQIPLCEWLPGGRHKPLGILVASVPVSTRGKDQGKDHCLTADEKAIFSACRRLKGQKS